MDGVDFRSLVIVTKGLYIVNADFFLFVGGSRWVSSSLHPLAWYEKVMMLLLTHKKRDNVVGLSLGSSRLISNFQW